MFYVNSQVIKTISQKYLQKISPHKEWKRTPYNYKIMNITRSTSHHEESSVVKRRESRKGTLVLGFLESEKRDMDR